MKTLLHIIATPRETDSRTLQISEAFFKAFKEKYPDCSIDELNLATETIPSLSTKRVDGKYMLLSGKDLFGQARESWEEIVQNINRFLAADMYVISTPMWNFTIPYLLKQYIDVIVQPRYLFNYKDQGVEGLVKNKKMIVISSSGGSYDTKQTQELDFLEPYLRAIFGFVGIKDITFIKASPMDKGAELRDQKLNETKAVAKQLASQI